MLDKWLARLAPTSAIGYRYSFERFMKWMSENGGEFSDFSPEDLVNYQRMAVNFDRYNILDMVQRYVSEKELRVKTKEKEYTVIRSFFLHNRAELPKDPSFRLRSDIPPSEGTLSAEEIRNIILRSNPAYQAVFTSMFQGGMDISCFEFWNLNGWDSLKNDLKKDPEIIKVRLPGRKRFKNIRPFYTFIGPDAIKAIRKYLPYRDKARRKFENAESNRRRKAQKNGSAYTEREFETAIFYNQLGLPINSHALTFYWERQTIIIGLVKLKKNGDLRNRYGKNLHEIRDVFRSQWEKCPAKASVAEYMMGHKVDPLEYNKAFRDEAWTRKEYVKALPMLQIMSSGRPFGLVEEEEVDAIREKQWADRAVRDEVLIKRIKEEIRSELKEEIMRDFGLQPPK